MAAVPAGHDPRKGAAITMRRFIRWALMARACPGMSVMHVNPVRPGVGVPFYTIR